MGFQICHDCSHGLSLVCRLGLQARWQRASKLVSQLSQDSPPGPRTEQLADVLPLLM